MATLNIRIMFPKTAEYSGRQEHPPQKLKYLSIWLLKILPEGSESG
jgi:hypothetical protein